MKLKFTGGNLQIWPVVSEWYDWLYGVEMDVRRREFRIELCRLLRCRSVKWYSRLRWVLPFSVCLHTQILLICQELSQVLYIMFDQIKGWSGDLPQINNCLPLCRVPLCAYLKDQQQLDLEFYQTCSIVLPMPIFGSIRFAKRHTTPPPLSHQT